MSAEVRTVKLPYSEECIELPHDDFNYAIYKIDGYYLIYRCEVLEDGSMSAKTLWEKRKCSDQV